MMRSFLSAGLPVLALLTAFSAPAPDAAAAERQRVIVLGFDGADSDLARQWIESGDLPNLARLAQEGTFRPLGTTLTAQSPVSWASLASGQNPGKTNIGDFVAREIRPGTGDSPGSITPRLAGLEQDPDLVPADRLGEKVELSTTEKFLLPLGGDGNQMLALVFVAIGAFLVVALLFRLVFRMKTALAVLLGLLAGGGAGYLLHERAAGLPGSYPMPVSELQGIRFWDVLGEAGKRTIGLEVPTAYPADAHPNAKILAGLFTPDVTGGPGSWYIYTNDEWAMNDEGTGSGGTIFKLYEEKDRAYRATLPGPVDFVADQRFKQERAALEAKLDEPGLSDAERSKTEEALSKLKSEQRAWSDKRRKAVVDLEIRPDFEGKKATITLDGTTHEVAEGTYSDYFRLSYPMTGSFTFDAVARLFLEECHLDDGGSKRLRLFVPPVSISPETPPVHLPISSPRGFAAELASAIGLYDTVGWACYTNVLKDQEAPEAAFLLGLDHVMDWRTRMFEHCLERDDWDVLFHVESCTDRAAHMMYRLLDPEHPSYDQKAPDGTLLREKEVTCFDRTFKLKNAVKEVYKEMDRIVGRLLDKLQTGKYGDVKLMIVSDHGFEPWRHDVNVNVWLNRAGYLKLKGEVAAQADGPEAVRAVVDGLTSDSYFRFVDWENTKAYSMGLGKIYLNVKGREPQGIVEPADVKELKDEIIERLAGWTDNRPGQGNRRVCLQAWDALEAYDGPEENITPFGDIVLGLGEGYRVSGSNSGGGYESELYDSWGVGTNELTWSGDHAGNDPEIVKGIFFANFKIPDAAFEPNLIDIAPTVLELQGVALPAEWDGEPIPRE